MNGQARPTEALATPTRSHLKMTRRAERPRPSGSLFRRRGAAAASASPTHTPHPCRVSKLIVPVPAGGHEYQGGRPPRGH
jgi:hypothetical protein